jgi:hypothetical protein
MISGSVTPIPPLCPQRKAKRNQPAAAPTEIIRPASASSVTVRRVHRAVEVLYQTALDAIKRQTGRLRQDRENQRDNFFRVVADSTRGWNWPGALGS